MDRYFAANVGTTPPTLPGGAVKGYPQDGDISSGKLPTIPGAYAFWQIFEELLNLVVFGGGTPDAANLTQVATAVESIANAAAALAQAAAITAAATDATTKAGAARSGAVSDVNAEFTSSNQSLTATGYQKIPGGLILQWGFHTNSADDETVSFPLAFPTAALNVTMTLNESNPSSNVNIGATALTTTGFTAHAQAQERPFFWQAIGH